MAARDAPCPPAASPQARAAAVQSPRRAPDSPPRDLDGGPGCGVDFGVSVSAWVSTEPAGRSPGERRRQLAYKCHLYGSDLRPAPPQGRSQTCPCCKKRDPRNRLRSGREFACVHCGRIDRADRIVSLEIEARARRMGDTVIKSTRSPCAGARDQATGTRMRAALAAAPVRGDGQEP
ncbi:zinc ribbon domain-containing protein [Streptomyces sp. NPDC055134]